MGIWEELFGRSQKDTYSDLYDKAYKNGYDTAMQSQNYNNELERRQQLMNVQYEELMLRQQQQAYNNAFAQQEAMMAATPEKKVKDKVKKALEDLDVYYTMPFTAGYGNSGVPDFLCCIEGRFFGIECKAGKNTTTALQEKHLSDIRAAGGVSLVIDETNVDKVKELILANIGVK